MKLRVMVFVLGWLLSIGFCLPACFAQNGDVVPAAQAPAAQTQDVQPGQDLTPAPSVAVPANGAAVTPVDVNAPANAAAVPEPAATAADTGATTAESSPPAPAAPASEPPVPATETAAPVAIAGAEPPPPPPVAEPPTQPVAPAVAQPVEKAPEETPAPAGGEPFVIDRGADAAGEVAKGDAAVAKEKEVAKPAEPQPKKSFWSLFKREQKPAAQAGEPTAKGKAEVEKAQAQPMTQEELLAIQEEVRRQANEIEGLKNLDLAYQALRGNEFETALKYFSQALDIMPTRPHTLETRQKAMQSEAECEYRIALNYYRAGRLDDAGEAVRRALGYFPSHSKATSLGERIKKDKDRKAVPPKPVPVRYAPDHLEKVQRINDGIARGRQDYAAGEYNKAKYEFRNILLIDEKNEEAGAWLKKIGAKEYELNSEQLDRVKSEMLADVRLKWSPPVKQEVAPPKELPSGMAVETPGKTALMKKLNTIRIPQLDFRNANIVDVIRFLDLQSIEADKESPAGQKGVNFLLQLTRPGSGGGAAPAPAPAAKTSEEDLFGAEGAPAAPAAAGLDIPSVTLILRNILLVDALKYITEVAGLKYRVEDNVVVITPANWVQGEVITRTYKVQPTISDVIMGAAGGGAGIAGGLTGGTGLELGGAAVAERADVKKFFVDAGVPFPEGTSIVYKPSINLLIVSNTGENLEKFERILQNLNVIPTQVEIEARFVEIGETELAELGVEWLLADDWEIAQNAAANSPVPLSAKERIQINRNSTSSRLRTLGGSGATAAAAAGGNLGALFSMSAILTNPELTFILHALEQKDGVNLLSAPKVTTKSGANAEIKVVEELIYPTTFDANVQGVNTAQGGTTGNQLTQVVVTPSGFETRDLGVILNVTPTVGPDGYTIDLTMLPQVVELARWMDYGSDVPTGNAQNIQHLTMLQPIFHSRSIATSISIWDGQTVVMGGLITEGQSTTEDKVPFLGDIPLLGKLFQSKSSRAVKRNLLIFVTARLVDPAGNLIRKPEETTPTAPMMPAKPNA